MRSRRVPGSCCELDPGADSLAKLAENGGTESSAGIKAQAEGLHHMAGRRFYIHVKELMIVRQRVPRHSWPAAWRSL
jgi:hypothetical protein